MRQSASFEITMVFTEKKESVGGVRFMVSDRAEPKQVGRQNVRSDEWADKLINRWDRNYMSRQVVR